MMIAGIVLGRSRDYACRIPMPKMYLTKKQLAERFGVSASTIDRWLKAGRIAYFKPGGMVRFTPDAVGAFEKTFTVKATV